LQTCFNLVAPSENIETICENSEFYQMPPFYRDADRKTASSRMQPVVKGIRSRNARSLDCKKRLQKAHVWRAHLLGGEVKVNKKPAHGGLFVDGVLVRQLNRV
jgi:hypothetical protein